jgi:hypothetical protein
MDRHLSPDSCEWDAGQSVSGGSCSVVANSLPCYSSIALPCSCDLVVQIIIQREQQGPDLGTVNLLFLLPGASIGIDGAAKGRQRSGAARCTSGPTPPGFTADLATRADGIDHGFGAPQKVQRLGMTSPRAPVVKCYWGLAEPASPAPIGHLDDTLRSPNVLWWTVAVGNQGRPSEKECK